MTAIRDRHAPRDEHHAKALRFIEGQAGSLECPSLALAQLLADEERALVERFEKALRQIGKTLPPGWVIVIDPDGNYAAEDQST